MIQMVIWAGMEEESVCQKPPPPQLYCVPSQPSSPEPGDPAEWVKGGAPNQKMLEQIQKNKFWNKQN